MNPSRRHTRRFARRAAARGSDQSFRVLDAGAGAAPYRRHFRHVTYETADLAATPGHDYSHLTYVCDLVSIPVPDDHFDLVFCSQTLEHVREPQRVIEEFRRVLKPGGEAWITAPFCFAEHLVPWDFFRFSRYAWEHFAAVVGFEVIEIEPLEGFDATASYWLRMIAQNLPAEHQDKTSLLSTLAEDLARRDLRDKRTNVGMCKNYQVVYRKPENR